MKVKRPLPECREKSFLAGCRPIIGLDGYFLKGPYKRQFLSTILSDGNNDMYPMAFVVVEAEVKDRWSWFLEALLLDFATSLQKDEYLFRIVKSYPFNFKNYLVVYTVVPLSTEIRSSSRVPYTGRNFTVP
jgi:hypothetical protein